MYAETISRPNTSSASTTVHALLLVYTATIAVAELLAARQWGSASGVLYVLLLAGLLNYYGFAREPQRRLLPALALAPLLQILSSTISSPLIPANLAYLVISLPLLIAAATALYLQKYTLSIMGLATAFSLRQLLIGFSGVLLGIFLFYAAPARGAQGEPLLWLGVWSIPLLFWMALVEEFVFRGVLHNALQEATGNAAIAYGALIYTLLGSGAFLAAGLFSYRPWLSVLALLLVALLLCAGRARGVSLLALVMAHGLLLTTWLIIWPLVVA